MTFIEFNGLPCCGKSTIVNQLSAELKAKGIKVLLLEDVVFFKKRSTENKKLQLVSAFFAPSCFKLNFFALKIAIESGISIERMRYAMRLIKLNYQVKRILNKKNGEILLLDEGFIQFITSIPHDKRFVKESSVKEICQCIMDQYPGIQIVNCSLPIETTIDRSKNRQSSISRFDNLESEELRTQLCTKLDNIQLIQRFMPRKSQFEVNLAENIEENIARLKVYVEESIKIRI